jgi:hypothetical protein
MKMVLSASKLSRDRHRFAFPSPVTGCTNPGEEPNRGNLPCCLRSSRGTKRVSIETDVSRVCGTSVSSSRTSGRTDCVHPIAARVATAHDRDQLRNLRGSCYIPSSGKARCNAAHTPPPCDILRHAHATISVRACTRAPPTSRPAHGAQDASTGRIKKKGRWRMGCWD